MNDQQHRFALAFLEQLPLDGWNDVLDVGSGPGYQSEWFAQQGKSVTAFDLSPPVVDVPWVQGNAENMPFDSESFDAVWTHHAFEHIHCPLRALCEVSRVLMPNGWLFFTVPQIDGTISSGHINSYDMAMVVYHLAMCGFDTRNGYFQKSSSHLRCAVRKIDTPAWPKLDTSVTSLWARGRLPMSCGQMVQETGRFNVESLQLRWFKA